MKKPDFTRLLATVTALTLAFPALAQDAGSVSDFQLPSEGATPRAQAQGPVADGVAPPRAVRVPKETPAPAPTPAPTPVIAAPTPAPSPRATPSAKPSATPTPRPTANPSPATTAAPASPTPSPRADEATSEAVQPEIAAAPPPAAPPSPAVEATPNQPSAPSGGIAWWMWLAALLVVGAIGAAAGWFWRGRRAESPLSVPPIERPRLPPGPPAELPRVARKEREEEAPPPQPPGDLEEEPESPLRIALEPARLSVSLLNATLAYRILLTNGGERAMRDISIDGDMISAHASLSREEQLAAPSSALENRHLIRSLAPGETKVVRGEFMLPLPLIRPIRNGDAALFVPLARLRVVAGGDEAHVLVRTSVVGQRSLEPGGGLRPFRLDLGPRIYSELAQRAFG